MPTSISLLALGSSSLVLAVFLAHFFHSVLGEAWCHSTVTTCIGPYLIWNEDKFWHSGNARFRDTFSLAPKQLGENFGGLFVALLLFYKMDAVVMEEDAKRWRTAGALLFAALFACFPFAGGAGILSGFLLSALALASLLSPLPLLAHKVKLPQLSFTSALPKCIPGVYLRHWLLASLVLLVVNCLVDVFKTENFDACEHYKNREDCLGPLLLWPSASSFWADVNVGKAHTWGNLFSLDANTLLRLWGPVFVGLAAAAKALGMRHSTALCLFLAVFGSFGYHGNAGVILGFNFILLALLYLFAKHEAMAESLTRTLL